MTDRNCTTESKPKQVRLGSRGKVATENFIAKSKAVHGDKFTYENIVYKNPNSKVQLNCKVHGVISIHARVHLNGAGCSECTRHNYYKRFNRHDFLNKSRMTHGDRYDYDLVERTDEQGRVAIRCRVHGVFMQRPACHSRGVGCPDCYGNRRLTTRTFIDKARLKHGDRYDYSLVRFKNTKCAVDIICDVHGVFRQLANMHLMGSGCPICNTYNVFSPDDFNALCNKNNNGQGVLYVIKCLGLNESFYKVGITSRTIEDRFQHKIPYRYEVLFEINENPFFIHEIERRLHSALRFFQHKPSTLFVGYTECFTTIKPIERLLKELSTTDQLQLLA